MIMKLVSSLVFLIDDLTFLVYCEYEFGMSQQEAGVLFCVSALFLFAYGLTISGYLIDKLGVKWSLMIGFVALTAAKFMLTFVENQMHLYIIMCTISPFGISIIFPCLVLGVKKLTFSGPVRSLGFSVFYAFMVMGALLGGPIVDFIRRDIGKTQFEYIHTNVETGKIERRYFEVSAWRTICFFGFLLNALMIFLLAFYNSKVEERFQEVPIDHEALARLSCGDIFGEIVRDHKFWRFMLFSFVIVGSKMVFSLLFFMIPKMLTQDEGEDAPFGIYVSIAPLLIIIFLFFLTPLQASYPAYDLILIGCLIATFGPIPMFFGMQLWNFLLFIIIVSFAEALYAPMINVFTFNFTKEGREGTFLTLTAAPVYFTMALTGVVGGFLLENYYPVNPDAEHPKKPNYIWGTIVVLSASSVILLYLLRD